MPTYFRFSSAAALIHFPAMLWQKSLWHSFASFDIINNYPPQKKKKKKHHYKLNLQAAIWSQKQPISLIK
jgi:hypothetical protein